MAEIREVLLNDKNRVDYYENCPGCKIDQMKEDTHGIPFKHLFYVFVVVLAAGTPDPLLLCVCLKLVLSI